MKRKITLIGNTSSLKEEKEYNFNNDTLNEKKIAYTDLVFTLLNNPNKYVRPLVSLKNRNLKVTGNRIFFRALKQAGIENIKIDLLLRKNIPLEKLMQDYSLEFAKFKGAEDYCQRFLFFNQTPEIPDSYSSDILLDFKNNLSDFKKNNCIAYKALVYPDNPFKNIKIHKDFIKKLHYLNGSLRSVDGIQDRTGIFAEYID